MQPWKSSTTRPLSRAWPIALACAAALGCDAEQTAKPGPRNDDPQVHAVAKPATKDPDQTAKAATAPTVDRAGKWSRHLAEAEAQLSAGKFDEAQRALGQLDAIYANPERPSVEQLEQRRKVEERLSETRQAAASKKQTDNLAAAQKAMDFGQLEEAMRLVGEVVANNPSPAQQEQANKIRDEVERRRRAKRDLAAYVNMLASSTRREVEAAQFQLLKDPDTALSLLAELSQRSDKPALVTNALETLTLLDRPQQALPILVEVLKRDSQRDLWQVAAREIVRLGKPGAGPALLELALAEAPVEQRMTALETLAQVVDPPSVTLLALLPLLHGEGPLLRLALHAALHGVIVHEQFDLLSQAGIDAELTPQQAEQLEKLPERLAALASAGASAPAEIALVAQSLATVLGQSPPQAISGVKIHHVEAEFPEGPAAAAIDGIWSSIDPKTMWRYPIEKRGVITLDLGQERTVVGIKIWNWNEPSGVTRGWKEAEIYVGSTGSETTPVARGIVPLAPGAVDTPDYGTIISVPCVRGRFVRLQAASLWQPSVHSGLAEIQVLGF